MVYSSLLCIFFNQTELTEDEFNASPTCQHQCKAGRIELSFERFFELNWQMRMI